MCLADPLAAVNPALSPLPACAWAVERAGTGARPRARLGATQCSPTLRPAHGPLAMSPRRWPPGGLLRGPGTRDQHPACPLVVRVTAPQPQPLADLPSPPAGRWGSPPACRPVTRPQSALPSARFPRSVSWEPFSRTRAPPRLTSVLRVLVRPPLSPKRSHGLTRPSPLAAHLSGPPTRSCPGRDRQPRQLPPPRPARAGALCDTVPA